jgi:hypothetical protein
MYGRRARHVLLTGVEYPHLQALLTLGEKIVQMATVSCQDSPINFITKSHLFEKLAGFSESRAGVSTIW